MVTAVHTGTRVGTRDTRKSDITIATRVVQRESRPLTAAVVQVTTFWLYLTCVILSKWRTIISIPCKHEVRTCTPCAIAPKHDVRERILQILVDNVVIRHDALVIRWSSIDVIPHVCCIGWNFNLKFCNKAHTLTFISTHPAPALVYYTIAHRAVIVVDTRANMRRSDNPFNVNRIRLGIAKCPIHVHSRESPRTGS